MKEDSSLIYSSVSVPNDVLDGTAQPEPYQEITDAIAEIMIAKDCAIQKLVKPLSNEVLLAVADKLQDQSGCHGFRVEEYDSIADLLRGEVAFRKMIEKADASGATSYCLCCDGECESEKKHEENAARKYPPMTEEIAKIHEMPRNALIQALIEARGLLWTDQDYAELIRAAAEAKAHPEMDEEPPATRKTCPDCRRPVAGVFDEVICNTGACGCKTSRSLCWRGWNGNVCCQESPYAPKEKS